MQKLYTDWLIFTRLSTSHNTSSKTTCNTGSPYNPTLHLTSPHTKLLWDKIKAIQVCFQVVGQLPSPWLMSRRGNGEREEVDKAEKNLSLVSLPQECGLWLHHGWFCGLTAWQVGDLSHVRTRYWAETRCVPTGGTVRPSATIATVTVKFPSVIRRSVFQGWSGWPLCVVVLLLVIDLYDTVGAPILDV